MSFHQASKDMGNARYQLHGFKWFMCLLKLAAHKADKGFQTINDPAGSGFCKDENLALWAHDERYSKS